MEQDEVRIPTEMEWAQWKQFAEDGDAEAQYQLGRCYANGLGVEIDMGEAVRWFTLSAEQGMAMAQYALGNCYYYGYGVDHDCVKAVEWYAKAAERGVSKAQCFLATLKTENRELDDRYFDRCCYWFRKAADEGDAEAQWNLSQRCALESKEERYWCAKAAAQGHREAIYRLGEMSKPNEDVEAVLVEAAKGNIEAMCELGEFYELGDGVGYDPTKAIHWYRQAAEQGNEEAAQGLRRVEDMLETLAQMRRDAEQGDAEAMYSLGICCYGDWGDQDLEQAIYWCGQAVEREYEPAVALLEQLKSLMINEADV